MGSRKRGQPTRRDFLKASSLATAGFLLFGCMGTQEKSPGNVSYWLTAEQKHRAEQLTSLFENSVLEIQYDYVENLNDGRGFTAVRAGFTTATGDLLEVVSRYTEKNHSNALAKFLPRLKELATSGSDEITGLGEFETAWKTSTDDPVFRTTQDEVVDDFYYKPAMMAADMLGLRTPLARAVVYDTIIQHGNGEDPDGLPALLNRTQAETHGTPQNGIDERVWLKAFLKIRRADLANAYDVATRDAWAQSVSRVDVFSQIADSENYELRGPIVINVPPDYPNITIN